MKFVNRYILCIVGAIVLGAQMISASTDDLWSSDSGSVSSYPSFIGSSEDDFNQQLLDALKAKVRTQRKIARVAGKSQKTQNVATEKDTKNCNKTD